MGIVSDTSQMVLMGKTVKRFTLQSSGTYDIVVKIGFPFCDKNFINISIDNDETTFKESRLWWWPYWRTTCWLTLKKNISLSAGVHSVKVKLVYSFMVLKLDKCLRAFLIKLLTSIS